MSDMSVGVCVKAYEASRQHKETCLGSMVLCGDCVAMAGLNIKVHPVAAETGARRRWPPTDSGERGDDGNPY